MVTQHLEVWESRHFGEIKGVSQRRLQHNMSLWGVPLNNNNNNNKTVCKRDTIKATPNMATPEAGDPEL